MSSEALRLADELVEEAERRVCHVAMAPASLLKDSASLLRTQAARIAELEAKIAEEDARTTRICGLLGASNAERDQLRAELETERMRLAACGVIATSNTPESAVANRVMLPEFWSASAQDVASAVDREMALRAEVERLREFFDADMAVAKIYDEVSPGLTSPKGAEWSDRVEAAIARRCAAVIAIEAAKEAK